MRGFCSSPFSLVLLDKKTQELHPKFLDFHCATASTHHYPARLAGPTLARWSSFVHPQMLTKTPPPDQASQHIELYYILAVATANFFCSLEMFLSVVWMSVAPAMPMASRSKAITIESPPEETEDTEDLIDGYHRLEQCARWSVTGTLQPDQRARAAHVHL